MGWKRRPVVIGLTGSIGMGKTTVAKMFERAGVPVFDADREVRRVQAPGGPALPAIEAAFPGTTGPSGLDRSALGERVFGDPSALKTLEGIVHPLVAEAESRFRRRHAARSALVLDIPLLLEGRGRQRVDLVVVVSAPARVQRARVLARPGMTAERFRQVLASQLPDREKRARADLVIETGRGRRTTFAGVRRALALSRRLRARGRKGRA